LHDDTPAAEPAVTIVLLAGGLANRLPGKLMRQIGDEPMLLKVFRQLTESGRPCLLSVREEPSREIAQWMKAQMVIDAYEDAGPLGGLASAAAQVRTPLLFAAAGDLPNMDATMIDALERRYLEENARGVRPEVVLPRHPDGQVEPLAALYDTAALRSSATRALAARHMKVTQALEGLHVIYYDITADEERKFVNVNTADDLAGAQPS
jgi:molybdenum cofactor guanylyltransferase